MGKSDSDHTTRSSRISRFVTGMGVGLLTGLVVAVAAALLVNRLSIKVRVFVEPAHAASVSLAGTTQSNKPIQPLRFTVPLQRVVDGDTIRVVWEGASTPVRLLGIDAPEKGQVGYKEARDYLLKRIGDRQVTLEFPEGQVRTDVYKRLLATLYIGDENLCDELVRSGHAIPYR